MTFRCALLLLALMPLAHATTVVPPEFSELVDEADAIYRGRVTAVEARRVERADGGGPIIKTFVTVAVDRVVKGPAVEQTTLEFLGGTIGEETLEVGGMPQFTVGERGIVFVQNNGQQFCPLVRLMHGRYKIKQDATGRDYVVRDNGRPLQQVTDVSLPPEPATGEPTVAEVAGALSPDAFETEILAHSKRARGRVFQP